ncbi:MAG TPA: glycosyl hydrolase family 39 [Terriglobales bacterium]|nr:glycosyl hydrolase family 39 [Terriglobales bacterium]
MIRCNRSPLGLVLWVMLAFSLAAVAQPAASQPEIVVIDASAPAHPFPHFWEHMFGSGRASLSMRESYRQDLRQVKAATDVGYIRFHAIFLDDMGVYDEDSAGRPVYNFSYVDQVYDGLLENGVRPFVELSFMPKKLASRDAPHAFWYKQNVAPPKDWAKWDDLIYQFTKHLVDRYGLDEVARWYFEVWNEPNIDFWVGEPKQATYFELYDHSAAAVKRVSGRLRVGGPATAQAAWADAFIQHCVEKHVPVDFVSTHVYGNDSAQDVFGTNENIPRERMVCRAVKKVHDQIKASALPSLPLIWSEFNASYKNEPEITDSIYMGPWMADTIRQCDGLVDEMSYWSFSDVFEEQGVVKQPFYGGYGLIAAGGIPKPALAAFTVLHQLGQERLALDSDSTLVTRARDGSLVVAVWNLVPSGQTGGAKSLVLQFKNLGGAHHAAVSRVDHEHGDPHSAYEKMGSPVYPTQAQLQKLRESIKLGAPEIEELKGGELNLTLPPDGLAVIQIR